MSPPQNCIVKIGYLPCLSLCFFPFAEEKLEKIDKHSALTTAPATSSAGAFDLPPTPDVNGSDPQNKL